MTKAVTYIILICIMLFSGILIGYIYTELPTFSTFFDRHFFPKPEKAPVILEHTRSLSRDEQATGAGNFKQEFEQILATRTAQPK